MDHEKRRENDELAKAFKEEAASISVDDYRSDALFPGTPYTYNDVAMWAAESPVDATLAAAGIYVLTCNPIPGPFIERCFNTPFGIACGLLKPVNVSGADDAVDIGLRLAFAICPLRARAVMSKIIIDLVYYLGCLKYEAGAAGAAASARARSSAEVCLFRKQMLGYRIYSEEGLASWVLARGDAQHVEDANYIIRSLSKRNERIASEVEGAPDRTWIFQEWQSRSLENGIEPNLVDPDEWQPEIFERIRNDGIPSSWND